VAAVLADKVMVVLVGVEALVAGSVAADVDPLHEVEALELIEGSINGGSADGLQPSVYLERRQGAGLGSEQLDHLPPRAAAAKASLIETPRRPLDPPHEATLSDNETYSQLRLFSRRERSPACGGEPAANPVSCSDPT